MVSTGRVNGFKESEIRARRQVGEMYQAVIWADDKSFVACLA